MFNFAIFIAIYSYSIFLLGLLGILYKNIVIWISWVFLCFIIFWHKGSLKKIKWKFKELRFKINHRLFYLLIPIFLIQVLVNITGAFGPELGFDALWYHLTLPKLYLHNHSIFFIPGGLLYYSVLPKLGEMFYIAALSFGNEIIAKLIHFSFGLLICAALYKIQRIFFTQLISFIGVVLFYSNLIVGWESITAYIDLIRTFFEIMALWAFLQWWISKQMKWYIYCAIMLGLAITTKLLAISSLIIYIILIIWRLEKNKYLLLHILLFISIAFIIPLPWFLFAYLNTGNPIYPIFSKMFSESLPANLLSPITFFTEVRNIFLFSPDPLSPIYIISLPLIIYFYPKLKTEFKMLTFFTFISIVIWYMTPRGGGRYILAYLPIYTLLCTAVVDQCVRLKEKYLYSLIVFLIIFTSLFSIFYRGIANSKYIPVLFVLESKSEFLTDNLQFSFGDFYDIDNYFKNTIKPDDIILLYGFHNLYYIDFPYTDSSWMKKGDYYNYIATQNTNLPSEFKDWQLQYENKKTLVKLYSQIKKK